MHTHRLNPHEIAPAAITALRGVEAYLHQTRLSMRYEHPVQRMA